MEGEILLIDIETAPSLGYVWGKWQQDVIEFDRGWYVMCFAAKWLSEEGFVCALPDFKLYKQDQENDSRLIKEIWRLLDEADIVITHNGKQFDHKKINARFLVHGLPPPSPYRIVDTKIEVKRYFGFTSNKLDDLGQELGLGRKLKHTGFDMWKGCMSNDAKSWELMRKYNLQDIVLLEKVYLKLRPWMKTHPVMTNYGGSSGCSKCGSRNLTKQGLYHNQTTKYQQVKCKDCHGWSIIPINLQENKLLKSI